MKYSLKQTLVKGIKYLVLFGFPIIINQFTLKFPQYKELTVGAILVMIVNVLKIKLGAKIP